MVVWIGEVFSYYKKTTSPSTIFRAINILDSYYKASEEIAQPEDIHLTGIACIFIASKLEDVSPIPMKDIIKNVGKNRFKGESIIVREAHILSILQFKITNPTEFDFGMIYGFQFLQEINEITGDQKSEILQEILGKMLTSMPVYVLRKFSTPVFAVAVAIFVFSKYGLVFDEFKFPVSIICLFRLICINYSMLEQLLSVFRSLKVRIYERSDNSILSLINKGKHSHCFSNNLFSN